MFTAMDHIVQPFDISDQGVVVLSGVGVDKGSAPKIFWQQHGAGKLSENSQIGLSGANATAAQGPARCATARP